MNFPASQDILIVDNYDSFTFNLIQLVEQCSCKARIVTNDSLTIEDALPYRKIIISPGPGLPQTSGRICELIQQLAPTHSILGVCLGHQAIGEVFGAKLYQLDQPMHGLQTDVIVKDHSEPLFKGMQPHFLAGLYHSWAIMEKGLPETLNVSAHTPQGTVMAIRHRHYDLCGIQFHPESVMTPMGKYIMRNWLAHRETYT